MQSPSLVLYDKVLSKVLRQTAKRSDFDDSSIFRQKLITFLTHVGRVERKLKSASKKTLSDQILFQVNRWLETAGADTKSSLSPKNGWMAVLYLSEVLDCQIESAEDAVALLKQR